MTEDDELDAIDDARRDILEHLVGGESLAEFIARVSPHRPPLSHLAPLIHLLERCRVEQVKACVSMPPRHGKTWTVLHALVWMLQKNPADTSCYVTYADALSRSKSRVARRLAAEAGIQFAQDSQNIAEWRTEAGGGLLATGVGGPLTGQGISGVCLIDDPFKNRQEVDSETVRETIWEWFTEVAMTRLEGGSVIVVHTRWREDDLIGRLTKEHGWQYINLPALNADETAALWPEKFPVEHLLELREQIGEWSFSALYMGAPRPRGGNLFGAPHFYDPATFRLAGHRLIIAVDPAASEKTSADYSAAVVLAAKGFGPAQEVWVLDVLRLQVAIPALVARLRALQAQYRCPIAVESVGGFKAVPQMLRSLDSSLRIHEIHPQGDKFTRSQGFAAAFNAGRVYVPSTAPWVAAFLGELESFTGVRDLHDDQVDAASHGFNYLANSDAMRALALVSNP